MATKKKPCKNCSKKVKVGYAPLVIKVGNWAVDSVWDKCLKASDEGHYVYLDIIGVPPCIPTPAHPNCPKK